jgi:aminopeptidase N
LFDQPDLKATWQLSTIVDDDWAVVSNEHEIKVDENQVVEAVQKANQLFQGCMPEKPKVVSFPKSAKISTYLYAIVAGPYGYFERENEGLPPMRIYARLSLLESVNHQLMFDITIGSMKFYNEYFGVTYPFNKYDQVFVAEHNYGAMENVGCVTYNESYLFRGEAVTLSK